MRRNGPCVGRIYRADEGARQQHRAVKETDRDRHIGGSGTADDDAVLRRLEGCERRVVSGAAHDAVGAPGAPRDADEPL